MRSRNWILRWARFGVSLSALVLCVACGKSAAPTMAVLEESARGGLRHGFMFRLSDANGQTQIVPLNCEGQSCTMPLVLPLGRDFAVLYQSFGSSSRSEEYTGRRGYRGRVVLRRFNVRTREFGEPHALTNYYPGMGISYQAASNGDSVVVAVSAVGAMDTSGKTSNPVVAIRVIGKSGMVVGVQNLSEPGRVLAVSPLGGKKARIFLREYLSPEQAAVRSLLWDGNSAAPEDLSIDTDSGVQEFRFERFDVLAWLVPLPGECVLRIEAVAQKPALERMPGLNESVPGARCSGAQPRKHVRISPADGKVAPVEAVGFSYFSGYNPMVDYFTFNENSWQRVEAGRGGGEVNPVT